MVAFTVGCFGEDRVAIGGGGGNIVQSKNSDIATHCSINKMTM